MILRAKYMIIAPIILALSCNVLAQSNGKSMYFWRLNSVSGEARLEAHYREQEQIGVSINETQKSSFLSGGLLIRTNSSILHPNFMVLDVDAGFFPATSRDTYIVVPDQSEVRTVKKLDVTALFFKQKPINISLFGNFDESYSTRENLTDVKTVNRHLGTSLVYSNKFLPVTFDFHSRKWDEKEIQTGRSYTLDQKLFNASAIKSFTKRDRNEFRYSHDDNVNVNQNLYRVANTIDNIDFYSRINLDAKQKYNLNTTVSNISQYGNINLKRFQASESFMGQLPKNFSVYISYNFYKSQQESNNLQQHNVNASLKKKIYESLITGVNFEYNKINHTVYKEYNTKAGFELNYTKKIPTGGQLIIAYRFDRYHQDYTADPSARSIVSEPYTLTDSKIVLLRLPDINIATVVVKDYSGTLIYQIGIDYILVERGKYIEIRRIPGGLIANNSAVLVDYTAIQPGSYKYDANAHVLNTSVYLLNNVLSFYYRFSTQDYTNLVSTEFVTLNYFTQNLVGTRVDFGFFYAGIEYEDYKSSILPYRMTRYYANFQKYIGNKLMVMLNGNVQDYVMLDKPEPEYQKYMDVTGKAIYTIYKLTSLNVDLMYRKQKGSGIDLDLFTAKTEITSIISRLYVTLGVELYHRNYVGEILNFKGTYIKIVRKF
jgi:hypothetical protein